VARATSITSRQGRDLLEIIDDRHGRGSTIVTSQLPVDHWHEVHRWRQFLSDCNSFLASLGRAPPTWVGTLRRCSVADAIAHSCILVVPVFCGPSMAADSMLLCKSPKAVLAQLNEITPHDGIHGIGAR
jgi:hypothetical protein